MRSSISDRSLYIRGSSDEEEDEEEEQRHIGVDKEGGYETGEESSESDEGGSPRGTRPNSYTTSWPQSYRQSIDIYSSVTPPNIGGFLSGTPGALSRLGSSFITSSFQGRHTPEIISSLIKPLLPFTSEQHEQQRKSSHSLLPPPPPTRRHSARLRDDQKPPSRVSSHQVSTPRRCSLTQAVLNGIPNESGQRGLITGERMQGQRERRRTTVFGASSKLKPHTSSGLDRHYGDMQAFRTTSQSERASGLKKTIYTCSDGGGGDMQLVGMIPPPAGPTPAGGVSRARERKRGEESSAVIAW